MSSHPDSLHGIRRNVGWDKEFTLNPGGSVWLSKPKAMPTIGCCVMTKQGTCALLTHGACHKHEMIPGKSLSAINSTCYWVKWLKPHLLLVSPRSDCSAAAHDLKAQTRESSTFVPLPGDICECFWDGKQVTSLPWEKQQPTAWKQNGSEFCLKDCWLEFAKYF